MADVFDGNVWKEFLDSDGNAFFSTQQQETLELCSMSTGFSHKNTLITDVE